MPKPRSWPGSPETKRLAELSKPTKASAAHRGRLGRPHWSTTCRCHPGVDRLLAAAGAWSLAKQAVMLWTPEPPSRLILWMAKAPSTAAIAPGLG